MQTLTRISANILVLKQGYHKKIPPGSPEDPLNVTVSVDLLRLVDINEEDYSIDIQFEISLKWKDERLRFHNLKQRETLNALAEEDVEKLWLPKVIFENTDQRDTTRLGEYGGSEWETRVIVQKEQQNGKHSNEHGGRKPLQNSVRNQTF